MNLFKTTDSQKAKISQIADEMRAAGIYESLVAQIIKLAEIYEGAFDLIELWRDEEEVLEREQIITALQEEINENGSIKR